MQLLVDSDVDAGPVVDDDGAVVGMLSTGDLIVEEARVHFPTVVNFLGVNVACRSTTRSSTTGLEGPRRVRRRGHDGRARHGRHRRDGRGRGHAHARPRVSRVPWSTATASSSASSPGATSCGPSSRTSAAATTIEPSGTRPRGSRSHARGTGRGRPRGDRAQRRGPPRAVAPAELCAVVKADGYGHGAIAVAQAALDAGATWLGVALVEEGAVLRKAGIDGADPAAVPAPAGRHRRRRALRPAPQRLHPRGRRRRGRRRPASGVVAGVHLKVNTGMNRVGAGRDESSAGPGDRQPAGARARGAVDPLRGRRRARQPVHRRAARPLRRGRSPSSSGPGSGPPCATRPTPRPASSTPAAATTSSAPGSPSTASPRRRRSPVGSTCARR